jgi:L-asparaginase/Glu-tRNA(Gln) amidotransferase subunit D
VVLHGTDTMTQTGSYLSFMLQNLTKPVILTGAQISVFKPNSGKQFFIETVPKLAKHINFLVKFLQISNFFKVDDVDLL